MMLGELCKKEKKKTYCLNLSAEFICAKYKEEMLKLLPLVKILFSNADEAKAFATANKIKYKSMTELAVKISSFQLDTDKVPRTCVVTQSKDPVIVAKGD